MNLKTKIIILLILFSIGLFLGVYEFLDTKLQGYLVSYETAFIDEVIDGDTVKSNGTSIRLLGINTPERGEIHYSEAKEFLEDLVLNKTVRLEFGKEKEDRYKRTLAYLYYENKNINLELVKEGYANIYFPSGRDSHYNQFIKTWESCSENLCKISNNKCANCIILKRFDYKNEIIVFDNICNFDCELTNWEIKDEGRKKFIFSEFVLKNYEEIEIILGSGNNEEVLYWENQDYVWTDSGDTLFLRDENNLLVLWESY